MEAAMKKLLLAGMLAFSSPAYADWQCGEVKVEVKKLTSDHLAEVRFEGFFKDMMVKDGFRFQFTKDGAKLNGKRCKEIND
jgi:hypothetical protein